MCPFQHQGGGKEEDLMSAEAGGNDIAFERTFHSQLTLEKLHKVEGKSVCAIRYASLLAKEWMLQASTSRRWWTSVPILLKTCFRVISVISWIAVLVRSTCGLVLMTLSQGKEQNNLSQCHV